MKLIIDIPKQCFEFINTYGIHDINQIEQIIANGTPLEEKTGHWKKISPAGIMECSVCGGNVLTSDIEAYKYCHHCGAKMEGE